MVVCHQGVCSYPAAALVTTVHRVAGPGVSAEAAHLWSINTVSGDRLLFKAHTVCVFWHVQEAGIAQPWKRDFYSQPCIFFTTVGLFCFVLVHIGQLREAAM